MKKLFKLFSLVLLVVVAVTLVGCKKETQKPQPEDSKPLKVLSPQGAPSMALGELFGQEKYQLTTVSGPDLLKANLIKKDYDIIVAPVILGAVLNSKGKTTYKLSKVITTGNLFIVCKEPDKISDLSELAGKEIAAFGKNNSPDIMLRLALKEKGVESIDKKDADPTKDATKAKIDYTSANFAEVMSTKFMAKTGAFKYALTAEPILTKIDLAVTKKTGKGLVKYDLSKILEDKLPLIPQAGIFVKEGLKNDSIISDFLKDVEKSVNNANKDAAAYAKKLVAIEDEAASFFKKMTAPILEKAIPSSSIVFKDAKENKADLDKYFAAINEYNAKMLGGKAVGESFYN